MNDFFDLDAPLFRFLTRVADMVILSLLWLIGSLPLFTLGISSTALYYAVNKSLIEDRGTVSEEFFRAFRRSFRQATLSFLALAVPESILLADCFMTHYLKGQQAATGNLWIIFTVLSTCGLAWMIYNAAYAARFDDPVKKTVLQSGAMALLHFDKSLLLLVVLSVIIAHTVLGPIGWKIGTFISDIVYAGISGSFRVVFGAIFGFVYAPLVITGLHHMSNAIDMQLIADFGGTMLWPMIALSNIAQGSAVLGMIYLQRKNAAAQEVNVPSCISCYLGVTEPAMFGVNLKFHFPFICGMIGSAIAAVVCVATSTTANAIGVGGIPGILSIQPAYMLSFALCMVIAIVVPFVLTVSVGKKKGIA